MLNKREQIDLVEQIQAQVGNIGDYLYDDGDVHTNSMIEKLESLLTALRNSFHDDNTYVKLVDRETNEVLMKHFDEADVCAVCRFAAKVYCFSDCDDTYRIEKIVCGGRELEYVGWQPAMLFEFVDVKTKEVVYSNNFYNWDH